MPKPRYAQISAGETPYVHVVSRTVRRSFLCGKDKYSGRNFNHRRKWLEDEMLRLAGVFALEICSYAVMSNHYHIVLHINPAEATRWSHDEVIERWHQLFKGSIQSQQYMAGEALPKAQIDLLKKQVKEWQSRLTNISWFMRILNEKIATVRGQRNCFQTLPGQPQGYRLWECAGCGECLLQRYSAEDDWSSDESELKTDISPERTKFHSQKRQFRKLPSKQNRMYRKTLESFNHGLNVLCAAGIRALLEGICQDKAIEGGNLKLRIDNLVVLLPQNIVESLHAFRFIGNTAIHDLQAPSQQDLRLALEICEDLLNFIYELDYKVSELKQSVDTES